jgi:hypothetical protein
VSLALANRHSKIFISYRHDDSAGHAGRLHADLVNRFGSNQIFFDINTISPGEDFADEIQRAVGSCDAMVVVIGRHWSDITDGNVRRLDNPQDFVRLEISAAINRNIPIIPVLIQGARMPLREELPKTLEAITRRQALEISDNRWNYDIGRLNTRLRQVVPRRAASRQTIGIIAVCITLLILGIAGQSLLAPNNDRAESVQISSSIRELYVFEPDTKSLIRFGIGIGVNPDKTSSYVLNYVFMEKVCDEFVARINTSVNVGNNMQAQELLDKGHLNNAQQNLLSGPITSKAKRLVSDAKAVRLFSSVQDDDLDTLIKDEVLDTLVASILSAK